MPNVKPYQLTCQIVFVKFRSLCGCSLFTAEFFLQFSVLGSSGLPSSDFSNFLISHSYSHKRSNSAGLRCTKLTRLVFTTIAFGLLASLSIARLRIAADEDSVRSSNRYEWYWLNKNAVFLKTRQNRRWLTELVRIAQQFNHCSFGG